MAINKQNIISTTIPPYLSLRFVQIYTSSCDDIQLNLRILKKAGWLSRKEQAPCTVWPKLGQTEKTRYLNRSEPALS